MQLKIIQQDMMALTEGFLFHQVNCQGVMGGGIARSFAEKWSQLEPEYREVCKKFDFDQHQLLGRVWVYQAAPGLKIVNVFGQGDVSRSRRMTSYDATVVAFEKIKQSRDKGDSYWNRQLYFPFKMGCGLGGGEWKIYSSIIEHYFPDAIICKYDV